MRKLSYYPPYHFIICLTTGISTQYYIEFWQYGFVKLFALGFILLLSLFLFNRFHKKILFSVFSWVFFIFIGIGCVFISNKKNYKNHYSGLLSKNSWITIKINTVLKANPYSNKYIGEVIQVNGKKTIGSFLLYIKKETSNEQLQVGNLLLLKADFKNIPSPKNPYQFDYREHLKLKGIQQQIFINSNEYKILSNSTYSLLDITARIRTKIQKKLYSYHFSQDVLGVINALLLGERIGISKELINNYMNAGAIHILAISGLHIGILLFILSFILRPLDNVKHGKSIKLFIIVFLLWFFACVTGLSASVVRAVTMFSFIAIGQVLKRKTYIEFSLLSSMFILLLCKPLFLFDVGFQLSYLAVFGIVWIQPILYNFWSPKWYIFKKIWQLITVSVAAQIGVLPISLYYFHQFSGTFLFSNLAIVPFLGIILGLGILVLFLSTLDSLPIFLKDGFDRIISLMNDFIKWIANFEYLLLKNISFSFIEIIVWYLFLLLVIHFFNNEKRTGLIAFLSSIIIIQCVYFYKSYDISKQNEFIVFHQPKSSALVKQIHGKIHLFGNDKNYSVTNYIIAKGTKISKKNNIPNMLTFKNEKILVVDSLGIYELENLKNPIIILRNSPKINLDRLIDKLHPKQIIADGSNYKTDILRWKESCKNKKAPFHSTYEKGAFRYY